jgi:malonyl-CoA O-methyltransferase
MQMQQSHIEKAHVAQRFAKAHQSYDAHAIVQKQICQQLMQLIQQYVFARHCSQTNVTHALEIGCGSGRMTHLLLQHAQIHQFTLNDLYPEIQQHVSAAAYPATQIDWLIGDIEALPLPQRLDLVLSSSALQWMSDFPALMQRVQQSLIPQCYLCFSTFGAKNLQEIKALTGQGLNYLTLAEIQNVLNETGFDVVHISESVQTIHFEHPKAVLQHLKATGVTASSAKHRWTKQSLAQFYQDYQQFSQRNAAGLSQYTLSYHPIYCIARRRL